jgi:hypothetical protein
MPPNRMAASLSAWVSELWSSTFAGNAAAVTPSASSWAIRSSSLARLREMRATSKPWVPNVRAMANPQTGAGSDNGDAGHSNSFSKGYCWENGGVSGQPGRAVMPSHVDGLRWRDWCEFNPPRPPPRRSPLVRHDWLRSDEHVASATESGRKLPIRSVR